MKIKLFSCVILLFCLNTYALKIKVENGSNNEVPAYTIEGTYDLSSQAPLLPGKTATHEVVLDGTSALFTVMSSFVKYESSPGYISEHKLGYNKKNRKAPNAYYKFFSNQKKLSNITNRDVVVLKIHGDGYIDISLVSFVDIYINLECDRRNNVHALAISTIIEKYMK